MIEERHATLLLDSFEPDRAPLIIDFVFRQEADYQEIYVRGMIVGWTRKLARANRETGMPYRWEYQARSRYDDSFYPSPNEDGWTPCLSAGTAAARCVGYQYGEQIQRRRVERLEKEMAERRAKRSEYEHLIEY